MPEPAACGCGDHSGIVTAQHAQEKRLDNHDKLFQLLFDELKNISSKLLQRPGWAVCTIISLLMTALGISVTICIYLAGHRG